MKEKIYTDVEDRLIDVISNFMLWYTTKEDRELVEEYIDNEHIDYNEWVKLKEKK